MTWGLGIGDWGLGIGDWGMGPNPQPPNPNPQSPIPNPHEIYWFISFVLFIYKKLIKKN